MITSTCSPKFPGAWRLALAVISLASAALACNAPLLSRQEAEESQPAIGIPQEQLAQEAPAREVPTGYQQILPDQPAQIAAGDGAILDVPQGAYDEQTAVRMELLPNSALPTTTAVHQLVSAPYELNQAGFADQGRPLTLRIPYDPDTQRIIIDNNIALNVTAAHELFHYVQWAQLPREAADKHRWWMEATAEWAEDLVYDDINAYYGEIRASKPNPPHDGYGQLHARNFLEFYAASSLVHYLEMRYPDFVLATLDQQSGLDQGESWYAALERILNNNYGAAFDEVMDDYFASYFYHWDFDDDMPFVYDINEPALLADPLLVAGQGMYTRVGQELPPISGRLVTVEGGADLANSSLVINQGGQGATAFVYLFAEGASSDGLPQRVPLPNSADRQGLILGANSETLAVEGFGGAQSDQPISQVHLVATNQNPRQDVGLDLEIYVLEPPDGLAIVDRETDPLQFTWFPSKLPIGEKTGDQGALTGYRLYSQIPGQMPVKVVEIEPTATSLTIDKSELDLDQGSTDLFMRAVDKYDNESPDSEMLSFGASLSLASATASESNCFISSVNNWEFCDITVALTLNYSAGQTPATISCILASSSEGASTMVDQPSGTVQLGFTDTVINMENRGGYPVLLCTMEPGGIKIFMPYDNGSFTRPE